MFLYHRSVVDLS